MTGNVRSVLPIPEVRLFGRTTGHGLVVGVQV